MYRKTQRVKHYASNTMRQMCQEKNTTDRKLNHAIIISATTIIIGKLVNLPNMKLPISISIPQIFR